MNDVRLKELQNYAAKARLTLITTVRAAGSGHIGGSLSVVDILTALYFEKMDIRTNDPKWVDRDRCVVSKGHCTPAVYSILALRGFFPPDHLKTFRKIDSNLSGHVEIHVPGVDMSTGSLGQGLSAAMGMALSAKIDKRGYQTFAVLGDGEIQEGQVWEACMAAAHLKLDNLTAFVDKNGLQLDGCCESIMCTEPLAEKFGSFGWNVIAVDGHDITQICDAIDLAKQCKGKPTMIIANTVKGKGVSFMENDFRWHGAQPDDEQYAIALKELDDAIEGLEE